MDLRLIVLADFANKSVDGKLNILGIFSRIWAQRFPAIHPEMKLVLRFEVHPAEVGEAKKMKIQLRTDDGHVEMELEGEAKLNPPPVPPPPGQMLHMDHILGINGLPIKAPGRYEFVVLLNGEVKGAVQFTAAVRPPRPDAAQGHNAESSRETP